MERKWLTQAENRTNWHRHEGAHTLYTHTRADIKPETQVDTEKRLRNVTMGVNEMTHEGKPQTQNQNHVCDVTTSTV